MSARILGSFVVGAAFVASLGCGGGLATSGGNAFGEWNDDQGSSATALWNKLKDAPVARGVDVAVGVTGGKLIGVPLDGSPKWTATHALGARPVLAGGLVVATGGGAVLAFDAKNGQKVWSVEANGTLRGAGDDGALTAMVVGQDRGSSELIVVARDGRVVRRIETDKPLGAPAMIGGVVFVPWGAQYVSAIDAQSGNEVGRILVREKTSHAWTTGGHLYFGEVGIFRFDEKTRFASQNRASHAAIPPRELPGSPTLFTSPDAKVPVIAGARDRIRLYARAADRDGVLGLDAGRYYGTYFRIVMGFDEKRGQLAWTQARNADVIGGAAGDGALAICDADGKVALIDGRSGGIARELEIGESIQSCVVQMDGLRVPSTPAPTLANQLSTVLLRKEADLATAQRLLLRELAGLEDEVATKVLIDLVSDSKTPVPVAQDARVALAGRRNGSRYMIEALAQHYDFLKDVLTPPPSGPIAQALAQIKDPASPAPLAAHLLDPATPDPDLRHVAGALAVVARAEEVPTLKQFFALYHGTAQGDDMENAVVSVGQALLRVHGKEGRALVERAAAEDVTPETLKPKLKAILESASANKEAPKDAKTDAKPEAKPDAKPDAKSDNKPTAKPDPKADPKKGAKPASN